MSSLNLILALIINFQLESVLATAAFRRYWRDFFADKEYSQPAIQQQLAVINNVGDAVLNDDKLSEVKRI